ncbi:MAG: ZIP family metal transporter [Bacilli bacterium]|nr:ZIP family metal transporter [Bacilli bacterium]
MPKSTLYAFILSFLAGISTILGYFIIYIKNKKNIISYSLSFAAGVMLSISLFDLIPSSYNLVMDGSNTFLKLNVTLIFIVIGMLLSMTIDKYLPVEYNKKDNNLYKVGIISMIAIILHNLPEGIATFITSNNNIKIGIILSISIALHNIPEGISIAIPIYSSTKNKKRTFIYTFISGMSEVFGSILAYLFLRPYINNRVIGILYAVIAGIMIHISFYELLPESYNKSSLNVLLKGFLIGIIIMLISHLLI